MKNKIVFTQLSLQLVAVTTILFCDGKKDFGPAGLLFCDPDNFSLSMWKSLQSQITRHLNLLDQLTRSIITLKQITCTEEISDEITRNPSELFNSVYALISDV